MGNINLMDDRDTRLMRNHGDITILQYHELRKRQRQERGFTLMELLIVLALIAVISMIAVPIYRSYVQGAKVTEGLVLSSAIQLDAEVYYSLNGRWPDAANSHAVLKLQNPEDYAGNSVASIELQGNEITVTYNDDITGVNETEPVRLILTADANATGAILWACKGQNIEDADLPTGCE